MTVAASRRETADGTTRRRVVLALLAVSVVLNLCFVAGAVWSRLHEPATGAARFAAIAGQLNLDPHQKAAFDHYVQGLRSRIRQTRAEVEPLITSAWAEIAKPQATEGEIVGLFEEAAEKRRAFQRETTAATLQFLATLSPEQRARFVALVRERHRANWRHRH